MLAITKLFSDDPFLPEEGGLLRRHEKVAVIVTFAVVVPLASATAIVLILSNAGVDVGHLNVFNVMGDAGTALGAALGILAVLAALGDLILLAILGAIQSKRLQKIKNDLEQREAETKGQFDKFRRDAQGDAQCLREKIEELRGELYTSYAKFAEYGKTVDAQCQLETHQLQQEIERLQAQPGNHTNCQEQLTIAKSQFEALRNKANQLLAQEKKVNTNLQQQHKEELNKLQARHEGEKRALQEKFTTDEEGYAKEVVRLNKDEEAYAKKIRKLEKKKTQLKELLQAQAQGAGEKEGAKGDSAELLEELQGAIKALKGEHNAAMVALNEQHQKEMAQLRQEFQEADKKEVEAVNQELAAKKGELEKNQQLLQDQLRNNQKLLKALGERKVEQLNEAEIGDKKKELAEREERLAKEQEKVLEEQNKLQEQKAELESHLAERTKAIEDKEVQLKEETEKLEAERKKLEEQVQKNKEESEEITQQRAELTARGLANEKAIKEFEERQEASREKQGKLEAQQEEVESKLAERAKAVANKEAQLKEESEGIAQQREELEIKEKAIKEFEQLQEASRKEREECVREVKKLRVELDSVNKKIAEKKEESEKLSKTIEGLKQTQQKAEQGLKEVEEAKQRALEEQEKRKEEEAKAVEELRKFSSSKLPASQAVAPPPPPAPASHTPSQSSGAPPPPPVAKGNESNDGGIDRDKISARRAAMGINEKNSILPTLNDASAEFQKDINKNMEVLPFPVQQDSLPASLKEIPIPPPPQPGIPPPPPPQQGVPTPPPVERVFKGENESNGKAISVEALMKKLNKLKPVKTESDTPQMEGSDFEELHMNPKNREPIDPSWNQVSIQEQRLSTIHHLLTYLNEKIGASSELQDEKAKVKSEREELEQQMKKLIPPSDNGHKGTNNASMKGSSIWQYSQEFDKSTNGSLAMTQKSRISHSRFLIAGSQMNKKSMMQPKMRESIEMGKSFFENAPKDMPRIPFMNKMIRCIHSASNIEEQKQHAQKLYDHLLGIYELLEGHESFPPRRHTECLPCEAAREQYKLALDSTKDHHDTYNVFGDTKLKLSEMKLDKIQAKIDDKEKSIGERLREYDMDMRLPPNPDAHKREMLSIAKPKPSPQRRLDDSKSPKKETSSPSLFGSLRSFTTWGKSEPAKREETKKAETYGKASEVKIIAALGGVAGVDKLKIALDAYTKALEAFNTSKANYEKATDAAERKEAFDQNCKDFEELKEKSEAVKTMLEPLRKALLDVEHMKRPEGVKLDDITAAFRAVGPSQLTEKN